MNTYAELYGNIKKRPLKCGLDNKMIEEMGVKFAASVDALGIGNIAKVGDTVSKNYASVSPLTPFSDSISDVVENSLKEYTRISSGMTMPSL